MEAQTLRPQQWLVVNDGSPYQYNLGQEVIARKQREGEGLSICENWLAAIPRIKGDKVIVWDDDDFYHPEFNATVAKLLDTADLAGVNMDVYFNLRNRKFRRCYNMTHASLAATGFRSVVLPFVAELAKLPSVWLDMGLWDGWNGVKVLVANQAADGRALHVGMKGMPGAAGLGLGHGPEGSSDPLCQQLAAWVGMDAFRSYIGLPGGSWA